MYGNAREKAGLVTVAHSPLSDIFVSDDLLVNLVWRPKAECFYIADLFH